MAFIIIIIIIIIILLVSSSNKHQLMWSDSKFPQVSRTLLSILANFNYAVVCMVLICTQFPTLPVPFLSMPLVISIIVPFIFHSFLSSWARSMYLFLCDQLGQQNPLFLLIITWSGFLARIKWSVCTSSHSLGQVLLCSFTIWYYSQISISCTIPKASLSYPVMSHLILFLYYIHLSCD